MWTYRADTLRSAAFHAVVSLLVAGCSPSQSPPGSSPPSPVQQGAIEPLKAGSLSDDEASSPSASVEPSAELQEPPNPTPLFQWPDEALRERIVLLTPGGPLILDAWITIDGEPHRTLFDKLLRSAMDSGDTDGDGRPTWSEWRENVEFFRQFAANPPPSAQQLDMWIETYDQNRDRRIQDREMAAWLGRDTGRSAAPLLLRSARTRVPGTSFDSPLWRLLDDDASGGLSAFEVEQAAKGLWLLDADDDRVLIDSELTPLEQQLANSETNTVRASRIVQHHAALHFGQGFDPSRLGYLLADMYAPHGLLAVESFSDLPHLFGDLDDGDQHLDDDELARLATIPAHGRVMIAFDDSPGTTPLLKHIELDPRIERLRMGAKPSDSRVVLLLGECRLVLSARDLSGIASPAENLRRSQTQLMVHDQCDALFEYIDADASGRLGEREVTTIGDRLAASDTDGDGHIAGDELPYTLIVAFTRGEDAGAREFYVPDVSPPAKQSHDVPRWFVANDFNGDGDISRREFLGATEAFSRWDTSGDGFIDPAEASATP